MPPKKQILKGVCAGANSAPVRRVEIPSMRRPSAVDRPPPGTSLRSPGSAASARRRAALLGSSTTAVPSTPSRRRILSLESQLGVLQSQKLEAERKLSVATRKLKQTQSLHADSLKTIAAEDMLWRKRFRTLKANHNRWLKAMKESPGSAQSASLDLLAAAAAALSLSLSSFKNALALSI